MNRRFIDWIWHIRGNLALPPGLSAEKAYDRLTPLFHKVNTSHERAGRTLTFRKKDAAPQDKMSVFDSGELMIEESPNGPVLRYHLISRILLFCFILPPLFVGFGQLTVVIGNLQKPAAEAAEKKDKKKDVELPQHWVDKALGAPAPEKPKTDAEKEKDKKEKGKEDKKPSPTPAYVFAGIFAALYVVGRILESRLIKSLFKKTLAGPPGPDLEGSKSFQEIA